MLHVGVAMRAKERGSACAGRAERHVRQVQDAPAADLPGKGLDAREGERPIAAREREEAVHAQAAVRPMVSQGEAAPAEILHAPLGQGVLQVQEGGEREAHRVHRRVCKSRAPLQLQRKMKLAKRSMHRARKRAAATQRAGADAC
eukprot:5841209-Alexandrium_andersonii.AAC.1